MSSPGVEWREPLHYFWVLVGYDIVHGIVMTISHVMGVDIVVTNRDRVSIRCALHGLSKVFGERRCAIAITVVAITFVAILGLLTEFGQARLKKRGIPAIKIMIQSSPAESTPTH